MKKVTFIYELESGTKSKLAYLINENNIIYFDHFGKVLCLQSVKATDKEGVYRNDETAEVILGVYDSTPVDQDEEIEKVLNLMKNMSLYEFLVNHFDRSEPIDDFALVKILMEKGKLNDY